MNLDHVCISSPDHHTTDMHTRAAFLQSVAHVDMNRLGGRVSGNARLTQLSPYPGLLHAAKGNPEVRVVTAVDPDHCEYSISIVFLYVSQLPPHLCRRAEAGEKATSNFFNPDDRDCRTGGSGRGRRGRLVVEKNSLPA